MSTARLPYRIFFGAAAEAMRRILIDNARRKHAARHGGGKQRMDIQDIEIAAPAKEDELLAINEALEGLATVDKQKAELVMSWFSVNWKSGADELSNQSHLFLSF
ncbi:MAG TPA: ECF-type sigma factor [Verrucomicrobiae bacterium]|nr:ECF-type sigma factor [Verrucomicrobiae bacterium]